MYKLFSFNNWLSSALDLKVFELTPKETVLGIFSDESSWKKLFHFYSLWQEIIFTVVNELTFQNIYITNTDITQQHRQRHYLCIHFQYKHMKCCVPLSPFRDISHDHHQQIRIPGIEFEIYHMIIISK
jgi:hypothetical protein